MPTYLYECSICKEIEVNQSITENALETCPKCAENGIKTNIKKLIAPSSFILKGGGWGSEGYK